jgi:hypothetical protein
VAQDLIGPFAVFACVVIVIMVAQDFTQRTAHLRLSLFRPYRGDPWPIGVEEDDDFRFNWTGRPRSSDISDAGPDSEWESADASSPQQSRFETVDGPANGSIAVARVGRVRVGRANDITRRGS